LETCRSEAVSRLVRVEWECLFSAGINHYRWRLSLIGSGPRDVYVSNEKNSADEKVNKHNIIVVKDTFDA